MITYNGKVNPFSEARTMAALQAIATAVFNAASSVKALAHWQALATTRAKRVAYVASQGAKVAQAKQAALAALAGQFAPAQGATKRATPVKGGIARGTTWHNATHTSVIATLAYMGASQAQAGAIVAHLFGGNPSPATLAAQWQRGKAARQGTHWQGGNCTILGADHQAMLVAMLYPTQKV